MHKRQKRAEEKLFDDGSGVAEVWRVENFEIVPQSAELSGTFFGGDSYVILYSYKKNGKECYVVYYWLVSNRSFYLFTISYLHAFFRNSWF